MSAGRHQHPIAIARRATRRRLEGAEEGFTLIELIITIAILPIILGGITVALLSVFGLQDSVQNRVGDSNDELVSASVFNKDAQSAQQIETATAPACGSSGTQLVGFEWAQDATGNYDTVVSYVTQSNGGTTSLVRQSCMSGASATPTASRVVVQDAGASPGVTFIPSGFMAANATWAPTQGLYSVTLNIDAPGSKFPYVLSGLPSAGASTGSASLLTPTQNPAGCNLADEGTGTYAPSLCFADFSSFTNANSNNSTCPAGSGQEMKLSIVDSPDILQFCVIATGANVAPHSIPTYYNPGGYDSEAFLGNNGFYTGIDGDPALYQTNSNTPNTVVTFTNIEVTNAVGEPATGWTLVTGDAESTDAREWMDFTTNLTWSVLPNSGTSLYGNACYDDNDVGGSGLFHWTGPLPPTTAEVGNTATTSPPPASAYATTLPTPTAANNYATGVSSILCESDQQLNKTGTLMLASPEPSSLAPQSMTVTMQGAGFEGLFLGVEL